MVEIELLVDSIHKGDKSGVNRWSESSYKIIEDYLRNRFRAGFDEAREATQETLATLLENAASRSFESDNPGAYVLAMARNNYFKIYNDNKNKLPDDVLDAEGQFHPDPVELLMDIEMIDILKYCISKLADMPKKIITFILDNPELKAEVVAREFNTSVSNIWTRKHRINKELHACIEKKS